MEGQTHDRIGRTVGVVLGSGLLMALLPSVTMASPDDLRSLPDCASVEATTPGEVEITMPWQAVLDHDGVVVEHRMTLRRRGTDITLRTGRRGFAAPVSDSRVLVGERSETGTTLTMVDTARACRVWGRELDRLAYDVSISSTAGELELEIHDPQTHWYDGLLVLDADQGTTEAMIDGQCSSSCYPNDGELDPAAFGPVVTARPVPAFSAGGWPRDTSLAFGWQSGEAPPWWARTHIKAAADDTFATSSARSPRFVFDRSAGDSIRYTSLFPAFCRYGIACASRNMPTFWSVWLRPHGTEFSWGVLRWCQKDSGAGCFDIRRVVIHELGHVIGLNHPSSEGFRLEANETVMHAITPARPGPGSSRHAFGRCDVATLQELYGMPDGHTPISTCNDVATRLTLSASSRSIPEGASVRLTARFSIADLGELGRLAGSALNGRTVKLRYRPAGSTAEWTVLPMEARPSGGRYVLDVTPSQAWEFRAIASPRDEGLRSALSNVVTVELFEEQPET